MIDGIPAFLLQPPLPPQESSHRRARGQAIIDRGIRKFSSLVISLIREDETISRKGFLQMLDPRVKILFLAFFVTIVSIKQTIPHQLFIALFTMILALLSRVPLDRFYLKIWGCTFVFGFLIAFPAATNVITPGELIWPIITLAEPYDFWIYHIPQEIGFTTGGLRALAMLCLRIMNSLAISFLVLYTTPFSQLVKALQIFKIPASFLLIISLSLKYIVVFSRNVEDMYLARKVRSLQAESGPAARMWVAGRMAYFFRRTERRYEEIYRAMKGRGYTGEYRQPTVASVSTSDRLACGFFLLCGMMIWVL